MIWLFNYITLSAVENEHGIILAGFFNIPYGMWRYGHSRPCLSLSREDRPRF